MTPLNQTIATLALPSFAASSVGNYVFPPFPAPLYRVRLGKTFFGSTPDYGRVQLLADAALFFVYGNSKPDKFNHSAKLAEEMLTTVPGLRGLLARVFTPRSPATNDLWTADNLPFPDWCPATTNAKTWGFTRLASGVFLVRLFLAGAYRDVGRTNSANKAAMLADAAACHFSAYRRRANRDDFNFSREDAEQLLETVTGLRELLAGFAEVWALPPPPTRATAPALTQRKHAAALLPWPPWTLPDTLHRVNVVARQLRTEFHVRLWLRGQERQLGIFSTEAPALMFADAAREFFAGHFPVTDDRAFNYNQVRARALLNGVPGVRAFLEQLEADLPEAVTQPAVESAEAIWRQSVEARLAALEKALLAP
jgi:hypothetical protein